VAQRNFLGAQAFEDALDVRRRTVLHPIAHSSLGKLQLAGGAKLRAEQINQSFFDPLLIGHCSPG
jgi:hypothetical protein